jgi:hypothetical protein
VPTANAGRAESLRRRAVGSRASEEVRDDLVAVRLVEDLVPCLGMDLQRDVLHARRAHPVDERVDESQLTVDRVVLADGDVDRKVAAKALRALGAGDLVGAQEHRLAARAVEPEAAERVGTCLSTWAGSRLSQSYSVRAGSKGALKADRSIGASRSSTSGCSSRARRRSRSMSPTQLGPAVGAQAPEVLR